MPNPCHIDRFWRGLIPCPLDTSPPTKDPQSLAAVRERSQQQASITDLCAVTSLSLLPHHSSTQTRCLDSWLQFGLSISAVNTEDEIAKLSRLYPQVTDWITSEDFPAGYDRRTQSIHSLARVALQRQRAIAIINSDIEIHGAQSILLDRLSADALVVGIRHNFVDSTHAPRREGYGLDAFVVTPTMAETLPALPFCIGKPVWDYWLPLHFRELGYAMEFVAEPLFYHAAHAIHWTAAEWSIGAAWLQQHYGQTIQYADPTFRQSLPYPPRS